MQNGSLRHDWSLAQAEALFAQPFADLIFAAQRIHRAWHAPNTVQMSTLLSIKTGACPEDCAYCPQSVRYDTGVGVEALMPVAQVVERARAARAAGATRFCMGAAYRSPKRRDIEQIAQMVREVRALGLETCATLGMLDASQAQELKSAGLDYYNHNLDTSEEFYASIITTRSYQDRLDTLERRARCRTQCLLRRYRRHGRIAARSGANCWSRWRTCRSTPRACRSTSWCACPVHRWRTARR